MVLQQFTGSIKISLRRFAIEIGISKSSEHRILKTAEWNCSAPSLLHAVTEDVPNLRLKFFESIQRKVGEEAQFLRMIIWTDEVTFRLNDNTVNCYNCVYWASENPNVHTDKTLALPGLCALCVSRVVTGE
jgi:hypothetical protein